MYRLCLTSCLLAAALAVPTPGWAQEDEGGAGQGQGAGQDDPTGEEEPPGADEQDLPGFEPPPPAPVAVIAPATVAPLAALRVCASLPLGELGPGGWVGLDFGIRPPWLGGRLLPAAEVTFTRAAADGRASDDALAPEAPLDWALRLDQLGLGGGLRLRLLRHDAPFSPELGGGAAAVLALAHLEGRQQGEALVPLREVGWSLGWHASAGMAIAVGPGHLLVEAGLSSVALDGVLTGNLTSRAVLAGLGYRVLL
ncbi:MAG: hypothetical protein ABIO70_13135 [Pseudomonadota bacterium]